MAQYTVHPLTKLSHAWKDVPLPDADEEEFATWLKKWDSSTNVEV